MLSGLRWYRPPDPPLPPCAGMILAPVHALVPPAAPTFAMQMLPLQRCAVSAPPPFLAEPESVGAAPSEPSPPLPPVPAWIVALAMVSAGDELTRSAIELCEPSLKSAATMSTASTRVAFVMLVAKAAGLVFAAIFACKVV